MNESLLYRNKIVLAKRKWERTPDYKIFGSGTDIAAFVSQKQIELGIFGGAIGILSKAEGIPILLYSPEVQKNFHIRKSAEFDLLNTPYDLELFEQKKGYARFVDLLFFVSRETPKPEYVEAISNINHLNPFEYPFQKKLRVDYEILHCSAGEVLLFSFLWRYILELVHSAQGLDAKLQGANHGEAGWTSTWAEIFENSQFDFVERIVIEKIRIAEKDRSEISLSILSAALKFSQSFGQTLTSTILHGLGVSVDSVAIRELNKYTQFIFGADNVPVLTTDNSDEFAKSAVLAFAKKVGLDITTCTLGEVLNELHAKARFPILPYYFLLFLDDQKSLKEHIVFPLWYTTTPDTKYIYDLDKEETAVLHALYTIKPIWDITGDEDLWYCNEGTVLNEDTTDAFTGYLDKLLGFFSSICRPIIDKEYYAAEAKKKLVEIKNSATRAAISQVMARNTSHNMGAHVMNRLIGDLRGLKVLNFEEEEDNYRSAISLRNDIHRQLVEAVQTNDWYKSLPSEDSRKGAIKNEVLLDQISIFNNYVKCRMDYLADISFGTPLMQTNKYAYSDLFKELDKVRLLLEHISGLSGFKYEIKFTRNGNDLRDDKEDLLVAIPNDILGMQAFYNILENIIRNTAKHAVKKPEVTTFTVNFINEPSGVDSANDTDSEEIQNILNEFIAVEVYDNVPVFYDVEKNEGPTSEEGKEYNEKTTGVLRHKIDWLVYSQNKKINEDILESNRLRASSLGVIEMDASAAYLRKRDVSYINHDNYEIAYNDSWSRESVLNSGKRELHGTNCRNFLKAFRKKISFTDDVSNPLDTDQQQLFSLGYRFFLLRPEAVLVVTDILEGGKSDEAKQTNKEKKAFLKKNGISVLPPTTETNTSENSFRKMLQEGVVCNTDFVIIDESVTLGNIKVKSIDIDGKIAEKEEQLLDLYRTSLPLRVLSATGEELLSLFDIGDDIDPNGKMDKKQQAVPQRWEDYCWAAWNKAMYLDRDCSIMNSFVPEDPGKFRAVFLDHLYSSDNGTPIGNANEFWSDYGQAEYLEALSSMAQTKMPDYNKIIENECQKFKGAEQFKCYIRKLRPMGTLKIKVKEAVFGKVVVVDERIQEVSTQREFMKIPYSELYRKINVIIPEKQNCDLSENSFSPEVIRKVEDFISDQVKSAYKTDFILIHYSILERMYGKDEITYKLLDLIGSSQMNIIITSGRGVPDNLSDRFRFVNLSSVINAFVEIRSKYVINHLLSSSRKAK